MVETKPNFRVSTPWKKLVTLWIDFNVQWKKYTAARNQPKGRILVSAVLLPSLKNTTIEDLSYCNISIHPTDNELELGKSERRDTSDLLFVIFFKETKYEENRCFPKKCVTFINTKFVTNSLSDKIK